MKTISKVLSMLLVIVMCVGLFGTSAYALNDLAPIGGTSSLSALSGLEDEDNTSGGYEGSPLTGGYQTNVKTGSEIATFDDFEEDLDGDFSLFTTGDACCKVGNTTYMDLQKAINEANGKTITLLQDCTLDDTVTIGKNTTIDLGGFTLNLGGYQIVVSGKGISASIKNGAIPKGTGNDILVTGGAKLTLNNVTGDPTVYEDTDSSVIVPETGLIAYIGSKGYKTVQEAIDAASNNDTIIIDTDSIGDINEDLEILNKNLKFNLNDEKLSGEITIANANVTVSGYWFGSTVNLTNSTLNLGSANAGTINLAEPSAVTVSGGTVEAVVMDGGTLNMRSGEIKSLAVQNGAKMNVSGGEVALTSAAGTENRTVTGGTWTAGSDALKNFLKNSLKGDLALNEKDGKYVVGTGSGSSGGSSSGVTQGNFTLYGSPYTKGSNKDVYITVDSGDIPDGIWMSTSKTLTSSNNWNINSHISSLSSTIYIDNDYLDGSSVGTRTYYLWAGYTDSNGKVTSSKLIGELTIRKDSSSGGTVIPDGGIEVGPRYENEWYQGDNVLQFYVKPYPEKDGLTLRIDGEPVGNLDWYDYHSGYFYLGTRKLESLESGWHTLSVETEDGSDSCDFYIGATLKAKDSTKHVIGSSKTLKYVCSEPISRVYVSGKVVDEYDDQTNYKLSSDGKTLTLTAAFLNDRTAGHTYSISVDTIYGNSAENTFSILTTAQASSSPKTGDNSNLALWISALVMSGAAAAIVLPKMRKKENET